LKPVLLKIQFDAIVGGKLEISRRELCNVPINFVKRKKCAVE
jgi:hypothetical protein